MTRFERVDIWCNSEASERVERALRVFQEELARRSKVPARVVSAAPTPAEQAVFVTLEKNLPALENHAEIGRALRTELAALPAPSNEGYRIVTLSGGLVVVSGRDERGILYGLGKLLRNLEIRPDTVSLPVPLRLSSSPRTSLRGHQLGYRPKTNAYDMWSKDQYRQYIRDLALFGANAIELLPPRTDDEPKTPEMLYDQLEMMSWLSQEIHSLGLAVWIWYPNMGEDFSDKDTLAQESAEREEVFSALPHIDVVMIPGGDPGDQEPSVLFEWGRIQSEILRKHHPAAELWISGQIFDATPSWQGAFFQELGKEPEWLGGVCHGPWVKGDPKEFRANVPLRYPIRRYPDITHTLSCQYPVRDWDPAFAATLGRECYNPRPLDYERVHNAYVDFAAGSLSYSEGINDDVNKFVWSDQDWDPAIPVKETLRDFARLFISPDHVEEIAEGLLGFERNWRGPILSNPEIHATFTLWRGLEETLPGGARSNYRFVMPLMRAYYDQYVQRRARLERGVEERIVAVMERLAPENVDQSARRIEELIEEARAAHEIAPLKQRCIELADRAFELIRWQTSVERHKGQAVVRGCFLDAIDYPVSDVPFYAAALREASAVEEAERRCAVLRAALERARPATSGRFIDLGSVEDRDEVVKEGAWEEDPSSQSLPYVVNVPAPFPAYDEPGTFHTAVPLVPVVERSYASTMYCRPLQVRITGLNPREHYRVRACYVMYRRRSGMRFLAGGKLIHDFMLSDKTHETVSYAIPEGCVDKDGVLDLAWQARPFRVYSEGVAWVIVEKDGRT